MDSLGDTYDQITVLFECLLQILKEDILIKSNFRKIDKQRIVSIVFAGQCTGGSQPSGMPSHDLDDRYGSLFIYIGIGCDLADSGSNILGSASKSWCMIGVYQIIVDCLWFTNHTDRTSNGCGIAGELADGIHGIIAANIEEPADV